MSSKAPSMIARLTALAINLTLGMTPGTLFFIWIERNCALPFSKTGLDLPLIDLKSLPLIAKLLWNASLFMTFGVLHSFFAQPEIHKYIRKVLPEQFIRTLYMVITGFCVSLIMFCWQHTGIQLYSLSLPKTTLDIISIALYSIFMTCNVYIFHIFGIFNLFGLEQIFHKEDKAEVRSEGTQQLFTTGIYGIVRHPIYTFFMSAFLLAPRMTLDRMWIVVLCLSYLSFGVPVEERKLVKLFGQPYLEYRKKVPAVIPKIPFLQRNKKVKSI